MSLQALAGEARAAACSAGVVWVWCSNVGCGKRTEEGVRAHLGVSHWGCFQAFGLEAVCWVAASTDVTSLL